MRGLRKLLLAAALVAVPAVVVTRDADASVSIAVPFDDLVTEADAVAVVIPLSSTSAWEDGRIYTYTRVRVERSIAGPLGTSQEVVVRTYGGVVDNVGQLVDGEPVFSGSSPSFVFLQRFKEGAYIVSARAQGQYPIVREKDAAGKTIDKLVRSPHRGMLLAPRKTPVETKASGASVPDNVTKAAIRVAVDTLHDRTLDDAVREVASTFARLHTQKLVPAPSK